MTDLKTEWHTETISKVETVKGSPEHHRQVVLEVLRDKDNSEGLSLSELIDCYKDRVKTPKTKRTLRRYLTKLVREDKVVWRGGKRNRRYKANNF